MEKEIHFTDKRVDESWKENISKEKVTKQPAGENVSEQKPGINFETFITSLGIQALVHLGEIKNPETKEADINLEAAKETIDLLVMLKEKTKNNLNREESALLEHLVPDLQLRFVQHSTAK